MNDEYIGTIPQANVVVVSSILGVVGLVGFTSALHASIIGYVECNR